MKLTKSDLLLLENLAREFYINSPSNIKLDGQDKEVNDNEFRWLCYLKASMSLLTSKGLLDKGVNIEIEEKNHEPLEEL